MTHSRKRVWEEEEQVFLGHLVSVGPQVYNQVITLYVTTTTGCRLNKSQIEEAGSIIRKRWFVRRCDDYGPPLCKQTQLSVNIFHWALGHVRQSKTCLRKQYFKSAQWAWVMWQQGYLCGVYNCCQEVNGHTSCLLSILWKQDHHHDSEKNILVRAEGSNRCVLMQAASLWTSVQQFMLS